jgi:hypothetical protein
MRKPCRVFDANGVELAFVTWCDTETGEVEFLKRKDGFFVPTSDGKRIEKFREFRPAPLRVVFREIDGLIN